MILHKWQDRFITLPDGRQMAYAEYGMPNGSPVLFFHGSPASSYIHADMACNAAQRGNRVAKIALAGAFAPQEAPGVMGGMSPMVSGCTRSPNPTRTN